MANQQQTVAGAAVAMLLLMGAAQAALVFSPVGFPFRAADKHKVLTSPYVVGGSDTKVGPAGIFVARSGWRGASTLSRRTAKSIALIAMAAGPVEQ